MQEFKKYLEENKIYIETLSILAGITALFLAIPQSNNIEADNFLGILKFTLLATFSIFLLIALTSLWLESSFLQGENMERENSLKHIYLYFIFILISMSSFSVIFNVWGYLYHIYQYNLIKTLSILIPIFSVICSKLVLLFIETSYQKFLGDNDAFGGKYPRIGYTILSWLFFYEILCFFINGKSINKLTFWFFMGVTILNVLSFILFIILKRLKIKKIISRTREVISKDGPCLPPLNTK